MLFIITNDLRNAQKAGGFDCQLERFVGVFLNFISNI